MLKTRAGIGLKIGDWRTWRWRLYRCSSSTTCGALHSGFCAIAVLIQCPGAGLGLPLKRALPVLRLLTLTFPQIGAFFFFLSFIASTLLSPPARFRRNGRHINIEWKKGMSHYKQNDIFSRGLNLCASRARFPLKNSTFLILQGGLLYETAERKKYFHFPAFVRHITRYMSGSGRRERLEAEE